MSLSDTLARAERDVESGDLGKARDRLEGLLAAYPDSLEIRRRLGQVYWQLQYPERAGRHWWLLPSDSPEMDDAKRAFRQRFGDHAALMLHEINYRGGIEPIRGTHAESALRELARRAQLGESAFLSAISKREPGERRGRGYEPWWGRYAGAAILVVVVVILVLAVVGLITTVRVVIGG